MNAGMLLMFSEEESDLVLKQEPADLSHLAPAAGDECIALDYPSFSMFHDLILDDSFLPDDFDSLDSADASFLDYDGSSLSDNTPSDFLKSPIHSKISDLLTPCDSPSSEDFLKSISESSLTDSQSLSFIPSSEDDLPLIGSGDMVMWGALPDHVNLHREIRNSKSASNNNTMSSEIINAPSLARLLTDPAPQIPVETTDLLNSIYPEQSWNNEETSVAIEPVHTCEYAVERASKRTIKLEDSDQVDKNKRQKCEPNQLLNHLMTNKQHKAINTQLLPDKAKVMQSTSRNVPMQTNSVLMNLLVSGVDVSAGYVCLVQRKPKQKAKA